MSVSIFLSLTVSWGSEDRTVIRAWCICWAVPSKNFPQLHTNSVSPTQHTSQLVYHAVKVSILHITFSIPCSQSQYTMSVYYRAWLVLTLFVSKWPPARGCTGGGPNMHMLACAHAHVATGFVGQLRGDSLCILSVRGWYGFLSATSEDCLVFLVTWSDIVTDMTRGMARSLKTSH